MMTALLNDCWTWSSYLNSWLTIIKKLKLSLIWYATNGTCHLGQTFSQRDNISKVQATLVPNGYPLQKCEQGDVRCFMLGIPFLWSYSSCCCYFLYMQLFRCSYSFLWKAIRASLSMTCITRASNYWILDQVGRGTLLVEYNGFW